MSKNQTIKAIRQEIDYINQMIDLKIIKGLSYSREARRHKVLLSQLHRISPRRSWLARTFGFV